MRVGGRYQRSDLILLCLVVDDWSFDVLLVLELPAVVRPLHGDGDALPERHKGVGDDGKADLHHRRIANFLVLRFDKLSLLCHLGVTHEHIVPRDSDVIHSQITVILRVVAIFRPDISHLNARQGKVRF